MDQITNITIITPYINKNHTTEGILTDNTVITILNAQLSPKPVLSQIVNEAIRDISAGMMNKHETAAIDIRMTVLDWREMHRYGTVIIETILGAIGTVISYVTEYVNVVMSDEMT